VTEDKETGVHDPEPQVAAGKVHPAFMMSLDGFVRRPGPLHGVQKANHHPRGLLQEYIEATGAILAGRDSYDSHIHIAPVLIGDGIRLYDAPPGGDIVHLERDGGRPTLSADLRYRPLTRTAEAQGRSRS
jgi:hypothetical protein